MLKNNCVDAKCAVICFKTAHSVNPSIQLLGVNGQSGVVAGQSVSSGVLMAKQLVDAPANFVTPTILAQTAETIASEHGMQVKILEKDQCEEMGCVS